LAPAQLILDLMIKPYTMKKALTILSLIVICSSSYGQNYKLFTALSKKLFAKYPVATETYSLSFDTALSVSNDSIYYNFLLLNNYFPSDDSCSSEYYFYTCYQQNIPSWIGRKIIYDNISNYKFFNLTGDTLLFNFNSNPTDSLVFYKDSVQKFYYIYLKSDTLNLLNSVDSARFYSIVHTDINGNVINSALNQQNIIISKNRGLVNFFQVDSFPQILKPLVLIGDVATAGGFYQLTNEIVYDYQPGDELQFYDYNYNTLYPPSDYKRYKKYKIMSRTITADSLFYNAIYEMFDADSANLFVDTIMLKYSRSTVIANIPFEKYYGQESRNLSVKDYCGLRLWTLETNRLSYINEYSPCDSSWCYNSEPGPPAEYKRIFVSGLGLYLDQSYYFSASPPNAFWGKGLTMIYFKKNGISCGSEMFAGIKEYQDKENVVTISPNPAKGYIHITSPVVLSSITLFNSEGRELLSQNLYGTAETIDIRKFHSGIFVARICLNDNSVAIKKIIIFND